MSDDTQKCRAHVMIPGLRGEGNALHLNYELGDTKIELEMRHNFGETSERERLFAETVAAIAVALSRGARKFHGEHWDNYPQIIIRPIAKDSANG